MKLSKEFGAQWVGITLAKAQGHAPNMTRQPRSGLLDHAPNMTRQPRTGLLGNAPTLVCQLRSGLFGHTPSLVRQSRSRLLALASDLHGHAGKATAPGMDNMVIVTMCTLAHLTSPKWHDSFVHVIHMGLILFLLGYIA
ncbi:hypothetical protein TanjilG_32855 [Lupinus angustifolius]|uniref:Uncharacterized protein n=1 Tax=Lupinus angustifolius TaxID=3871 RepID=A0A4P1RRW7_LUPAN|nr:hypothetical protein TanjilG_32855 [Lupinus angustifolius]